MADYPLESSIRNLEIRPVERLSFLHELESRVVHLPSTSSATKGPKRPAHRARSRVKSEQLKCSLGNVMPGLPILSDSCESIDTVSKFRYSPPSPPPPPPYLAYLAYLAGTCLSFSSCMLDMFEEEEAFILS